MNESALEGFVKIVELNSFSAAAEALYLSQSALSQQIRTLEGQLQFELFQHVPRRVVLTPAGWDFYPKAKQLLELYDEAVHHAQAVKLNANPPKRHLLIGHQNMPLQMLGFDLFAATGELSNRFSPIMHRCASIKDVWRALLNDEIDLSLQIECAEIAARGLHFYPAVYMPEIGVPFHTPPEDYTVETYFRQVFQMYDGEPCQVTLRCTGGLMKQIIDRFGEDVDTRELGDGTFEARVNLSASPTFYAWVFTFGGGIQIKSPESVRKAYQQMLQTCLNADK